MFPCQTESQAIIAGIFWFPRRMGVVSRFRSSRIEPLPQILQVQNVDNQDDCVSDPIGGLAGDWYVTIDLKDAYFHVEILPQHRKFLRFAFGGEAYQYRVLPFGLALSPRTYTKCMDAALAPLRLRGTCILNYIDDCPPRYKKKWAPQSPRYSLNTVDKYSFFSSS